METTLSRSPRSAKTVLAGDAQWYKDAVIYEVPVRAFADSNGDGIGDFPGLVERLDYLQDLGVTALWLLPFYPSPLRDDGYDIADYTTVHPAYGTLADFERLLEEAHRRGLRIITELVINHTSDQHPWFVKARHSPPGSPERDFYVWSDDPSKFAEARIIFKDFETSNWTYDPIARSYFWHRFYSHQPDLNYDNPAVWQATFEVLDFWLSRGVDGLRLDAVPYLIEREGTNCENLPETHAYLKALRKHVDKHYPNRMLLAEANQWPEDAAAYFGDGDECHMNFHFPLMPRLFMALRMEDRFPILDILQQTPPIPESCQWAIFLRNHDELTLEMVTDEDRDYMYRVYAQDTQARINLGIRRRLAPLLENHRAKIELLHGLLLSLPGTPVLYYGDEIGMGDNIYIGDRNGVRTPMQWTGERNAGFSRANPQKLYLPVVIDPGYHFESINVEAQQNHGHSMLWWTKRLLALRKRYRAFGRGTFEVRSADNTKVLAYVRRHENEAILVVANLSRHAQAVEIDMAGLEGLVPTELLGQTPFPLIGSGPYRLTLGGHAFHWFRLDPEHRQTSDEADLPQLEIDGGWQTAFAPSSRTALEEILPSFLRRRRWFSDPERIIEGVSLLDVIAPAQADGAGGEADNARLVLAQVRYAEGEPETYLVPLAYADESDSRAGDLRLHAVCQLRLTDPATGTFKDGLLFDGLADRLFAKGLLRAVAEERHWPAGRRGWEIIAEQPARKEGSLLPAAEKDPVRLPEERGFSSLAYDDQFVFKVYRRVEEGVHPEVELLRFLDDQAAVRGDPPGQHHAPLVGTLRFRRGQAEPIILGAVQAVPQYRTDAWHHALDALGRYYEAALTRPEPEPLPLPPNSSLLGLLGLLDAEAPTSARELIGAYFESARLLGQRTAGFHLALAAAGDQPDFAPEAYTSLFQRSQYQALRTQARQALALLKKRLRSLDERDRQDGQVLLEREEELLRQARRVYEHRLTAMRTRTHGNYHLGQLLFTGKDFVLFDLAGEPTRHLADRRHKRSPLRDVASMLYSFHLASETAAEGSLRAPDRAALATWARYWRVWVSITFLGAYLEAAGWAPAGKGAHSFLPASREEMGTLLHYFLLKRSAAELRACLLGQMPHTGTAIRGMLVLLERGAHVDGQA